MKDRLAALEAPVVVSWKIFYCHTLRVYCVVSDSPSPRASFQKRRESPSRLVWEIVALSSRATEAWLNRSALVCELEPWTGSGPVAEMRYA